MDNRLNKIRKEMNILREEMRRTEAVMRDRVGHDRDSTEAAVRLLELRIALAAKAAEWKALGGLAILPTVEERLKERREPVKRPRLYVVPAPKTPAPVAPSNTKKRKLKARV